MTDYRRNFRPGACYFFTQVTFDRNAWLCTDWAREALRSAIVKVRLKRPFVIEAWVLLPYHLHCLWRLPSGDADYSTRWRLIKRVVTKQRDRRWDLQAPSESRRRRVSKHYGSGDSGCIPSAMTKISESTVTIFATTQ